MRETRIPLATKETIIMNIDEHDNLSLCFNPLWEHLEREKIASLINKTGNMVDVGANIGIYTVELALQTSGTVWSIEPTPKTFEVLKSNVEKHNLKNVNLFHGAAGDFDGTVNLRLEVHDQTDNRVYDTSKDFRFKEGGQVTVPCTTIDTLVQNTPINFMKIDTQGYDYRVLKGAEKTLRNNKNIKFMFEFWPYAFKLINDNPLECLQWLESLGFNLYPILQFAKMPPKHFMDFIYAKDPINAHGSIDIFCSRDNIK